jgi:hypothetical protein
MVRDDCFAATHRVDYVYQAVKPQGLLTTNEEFLLSDTLTLTSDLDGLN